MPTLRCERCASVTYTNIHNLADSIQIIFERQIGIYTLYCILDTIFVDDFSSQLPQLLQLFTKTLNDPQNLGIRIITLRALGKVAEYVDAEDKHEVAAIQSLVPNMVAVLGQALEAGDSDGTKHGFDVLETLLYIVGLILSLACR